MTHTFPSPKELGKSDLARLVIVYQNKFDTKLNNINSELLYLKNKFTKLELDLDIPRNINNKLVDQVTTVGQKSLENKQYKNHSKQLVNRFGKTSIKRF